MNLPDFDDLAPERKQQFCSIGFVCQLLQIMPGQLRVLMDDCDLKFALVLDGIGYLTIADSETVAAKCRDVKKEISDKVTSFENN